MLDVEIGWDWVFWEHLHVRTSIGGAFTLASSTSITPNYSPKLPRLTDDFTQYGVNYLNDTYTSYVFTPVVGLGVGYAF
jgi:hypothetical protein